MTQRPLKILDLRDSPWVDGPGRTILQSASMVSPERCEILIGAFCSSIQEKDPYILDAESRDLHVVPIIEQKALDRQVIKQILKAIDEHQIDILHTHDFRSNVFGLVCAKLKNIPIISTCHGWISNNVKGKVFTGIDKLAIRFFDRIIVVSETMRDQLIKLGINSHKIQVIQNALMIDQYVPDSADQRFRQELGLSDNMTIIANIGRLSQEKGQEIFLHAAKKLIQSNSNLCFILIGIGPEQKKLEELVQKHELQDHVIFSGYQSDMLKIYNSLDLVVQSSSTEGMPNVILESLLMETPVVATNVGGTSEIVKHDENGLLIRPETLNDLIDGIQHFLDNMDDHKKMAKKGRLYVSDNFDHNQRILKLMNTYESVKGTL